MSEINCLSAVTSRKKFAWALALALAAGLVGCGGKPTYGDQIIAKSEGELAIGEAWNDGAEMIEDGRNLMKKGRGQIEDGHELISDGEDNIRKGDKMMTRGREMMAQAEGQDKRTPAKPSPPTSKGLKKISK